MMIKSSDQNMKLFSIPPAKLAVRDLNAGDRDILFWVGSTLDSLKNPLQGDSITSKALLTPNALKVFYGEIWEVIGEMPHDHYVLELGAGVGDSLDYYPPEVRSKIIPIDKDQSLLDVFVSKHKPVGTICANFFELKESQRDPKLRFSTCLGTNAIHYAKNCAELRSLFNGIDNLLDFSPRSGKKTILQILHGGGPSGGLRMGGIKTLSPQLLGELGYTCELIPIDIEVLTARKDLNEAQRAITTYKFYGKTNFLGSGPEGMYNYEQPGIHENFVIEKLECHLLHAEKVS
jgi:hypothetical protein